LFLDFVRQLVIYLPVLLLLFFGCLWALAMGVFAIYQSVVREVRRGDGDGSV